MIAPALYSSAKQDHNTPAAVLEVIRRFDAIGLDPCSNAQSIVGARVEWRLERGEDGLRRPWGGHGLAFVNWPYGDRDSLTWARKMAAEARAGVEIIGLGPARTETEWFQDHVARYMTAVCFWRGRITFGVGLADDAQRSLFAVAPVELEENDSGAPFPSVLPYFGARPNRFKEIFRPHGWCP